MIWIIPITALLVFLYYKLIKPCSYWKEKGVPYLKPWPVFGNMAANFFSTRSVAHIMQDMYQKFPNERYFGFHHYSKPTIMLRDPDLIKQICIRDYNVFPDHLPLLPKEGDPLLNKSLLLLKGKEWSKMRGILSTAFTSSKLKMMFGLMTDCAKQFVRYFEEQSDTNEVDVKDCFARYTNDVAASVALGISCDSLKNPKNDIFMIGNEAFNNLGFIKMFGYALSPRLMKFFKIKLFGNKVESYLGKVVAEVINYRLQQQITRPDILQILIEAQLKNHHPIHDYVTKHNSISSITDEDVVAQALLFYASALNTPLHLICVLAHELATNPEVQKKLQAEVDQTLKTCDGNLTYEALLEMKYLDMVVSETLRLWPVTTFGDRLSTKTYVIESTLSKEKSVKLDPGTNIWLPLYALQRDSKYFLNPDKFDPERFNIENRSKIVPFTYIPFGAGPRVCVATRLGLLETKTIMFYLLSKFDIVAVEKTIVPYILSTTDVSISCKSDLILGFRLRKIDKVNNNNKNI